MSSSLAMLEQVGAFVASTMTIAGFVVKHFGRLR